MRGIAALAVMVLHAGAIFGFPGPANATLAVDFFFCLSGFVLAQAYDRKIGTSMTGKEFMRLRLIRLYPLLLLSLAAGAALACWKLFERGDDLFILTWLIAAGALMVPVFVGALAFPLNFPAWSLFFELAASAGYAIERRRLRPMLLTMVAAVSGAVLVGLIAIAGQVDNFGVGGKSFMLGFVRVAYPFAVGLLIHRNGLWLRLPRLPSGLVAVALVGLLLAPFDHWAYDAGAVLVVAPLLVALGARSQNSKVQPIWAALGAMSYPVYLLHAAVLEAVHLKAELSPAAGALVGSAITIGVSYVALVAFDEPVRRWLRRSAFRSAAAKNAS